jgi:class 3 adenylate cyclase
VEAERRQVTVLFADMVGFTTFSERSGEEAAFTLMQSLQKLMEDAVHDQGGVVQGYTGDGIMAVFGAPVAYEDAPLRACRAALEILRRLKAIGGDLEGRHGTRPQLRIGINSGPAVVGKIQGRSDAAVGDTVNVAARLQALADSGSAVMSEATQRLVEGLVEVTFAGEHQIKGKSDSQKAYRLDAVRGGTTRFDAKIHRGLTTYVGRDRELANLEGGLNAIVRGTHVFDIVGEPGIGKSRLVHEFISQIVKDDVPVLIGNCTPDGQHTPFRAFIEIVSGAFRLLPSDVETVVARKLHEGLDGLCLTSSENLGLLLNLLGLKAPEGSLEGLDGLLIGLRTQDLLGQLLQARCRLRPLILLFEDLQWLDSASEALLTKVIDIEEPLQLLILHTRRPEYSPPWAAQPRVARLRMEPLSARETARIAQARIGVDQLPELLAERIAARAEGNALFAEEIASFLIERGIVRRSATRLDYDPEAVAAALPESVQSLLASRVDRLAPADRNLLQAAAVIGRRFDADLVSVVSGASGNTERSFAAMEALDLVQRAARSDDYAFKHALIRDALYNGLLSERRSDLHLKVAEELERRAGNRLTEIAEALAYHYAATTRAHKAFAYLSMAGDKSLDVYAIPEAEKYFRQALSLFEAQKSCSDQSSVAHVVVRLLETLNNKSEFRQVDEAARKFMPFVDAGGETPELVIGRSLQVSSLLRSRDIRGAHEFSLETLKIAERVGDIRARAMASGNLIFMRSFLGPDLLDPAERVKTELIDDCVRIGDSIILYWSYFSIAWDYLYRGLIVEAREVATRLVMSGEKRRDPRGIGYANLLLSYIDEICDDPVAAAAHAEECIRVAVVPDERRQAAMVKAVSGIFLGRVREGLEEIAALNSEFERSGALMAMQSMFQGIGLAMLGQVSEGIRMIEKEIAQADATGDQTRAAMSRIILAEVYIQILSGKEKPGVTVLFRNFWTITGVLIFGASRAQTLLRQAAAVKKLSERGVIVARINYDLGVLSAMNRRSKEARAYFNRARVGAECQGAEKLTRKIDVALMELGSQAAPMASLEL